jgi:hypothetical protein
MFEGYEEQSVADAPCLGFDIPVTLSWAAGSNKLDCAG